MQCVLTLEMFAEGITFQNYEMLPLVYQGEVVSLADNDGMSFVTITPC